MRASDYYDFNSNSNSTQVFSRTDMYKLKYCGGKIKYVREELITFKDPNRENMVVRSTSCRTYGNLITFYYHGNPVLRLNVKDIYSISLRSSYPYVV